MNAENGTQQGQEKGAGSESDGGRFSAKYLAYDGANHVVDKEAEHLKRWRGREPLVGLALSGGGIRSATYCLGVLQALAHKGVLPQVDYLSTVSGGGYIGSSLTYLLHQPASGAVNLAKPAESPEPKFDVSKENFPYVSYPMVGVGELGQLQAGTRLSSEHPDEAGKGPVGDDGKSSPQREKLKGRLLRRLRQSSNYLVPGDGITVLSLAGVVMRNLASSLAVHVALLVILFQTLFWSTWSALDQPAEGPTSARGSVVSVWSGGASKGKASGGSQPAPGQGASTTTDARSITTEVTSSSTGISSTTSERTSITTRTQSTITEVTEPTENFYIPAPNGFLRVAGYLLTVYAAISAIYVVATRWFDSMEKNGKQNQRSGQEDGKKYGPYWVRRFYERLTHWLFVFVLALLVVGGIPWVHAVLVENSLLRQLPQLFSGGKSDQFSGARTGIVATLIGVIGNVWGFLQARSSKKPLIPTGLVVGVASAALFFGLLLLVYILTGWMHVRWSGSESLRIAGVAGGVLLLIGWLPEANYVSLHRFYRDRLLELFLPDLKDMNENMLADTQYLPLHLFLWNGFRRQVRRVFRAGGRPGKTAYARIGRSVPGDATMLGDVCGVDLIRRSSATAGASGAEETGKQSAKELDEMKKRGPYHIINANVVLVASQDPRFRPRGGDNFIFSPLCCGSRATGWMRTDPSPENGPTLATAMAISGAAVNPNAGPGGQGITRQPVLSVLMGLLNLRLGYWVRNPKYLTGTEAWKTGDPATTGVQNPPDERSKRTDWVKPNAIYPGLLESFGRFNLNEHARYLLLTDGGHFENLGLYELVRRRLKLIIVCDATADPSFKFTDLSNAIQKVRADFGAIIDVSAEQLATLVPPPNNAGAGQDGGNRAGAKPDEAGPVAATKGHLIVPIRYSKRLWSGSGSEKDANTPREEPGDLNETGTLILLKATAFKGLPADLFSYRRDHPEFPNQGTVDQFFDERQFDAYRELGYHTAYQMLAELRADASSSVASCEATGADRAQSHRAAARLLFGWGDPAADAL